MIADAIQRMPEDKVRRYAAHGVLAAQAELKRRKAEGDLVDASGSPCERCGEESHALELWDHRIFLCPSCVAAYKKVCRFASGRT